MPVGHVGDQNRSSLFSRIDRGMWVRILDLTKVRVKINVLDYGDQALLVELFLEQTC